MTISLYFHIPFCTKKCPYCRFYSIEDLSQRDSFLQALLLEIKAKQDLFKEKKIQSIYFGGGTPFLFGPKRIEKIMKIVPKALEITIEANPETFSRNDMSDYKSIGINRLSLGVQSFDDRDLRSLKRKHYAKESLNAIEEAFKAGIENISIDLMYDIPNQTLFSWNKTLSFLHKLPIVHVSLYNLVIEPKTPFFKIRKKLLQEMAHEKISLKFLKTGLKVLKEAGFKRYEISAFAKMSKMSIHNMGYWTGRPFLGFGPSAFSYLDGRRFQNSSNLNEYEQLLLKGIIPIAFTEKLSLEKQKRELLAIGLRLLSGIKVTKEEEKWLIPLKEQGLLKKRGKGFMLSARGLLFYDSIASELT